MPASPYFRRFLREGRGVDLIEKGIVRPYVKEKLDPITEHIYQGQAKAILGPVGTLTSGPIGIAGEIGRKVYKEKRKTEKKRKRRR